MRKAKLVLALAVSILIIPTTAFAAAHALILASVGIGGIDIFTPNVPKSNPWYTLRQNYHTFACTFSVVNWLFAISATTTPGSVPACKPLTPVAEEKHCLTVKAGGKQTPC